MFKLKEILPLINSEFIILASKEKTKGNKKIVKRKNKGLISRFRKKPQINKDLLFLFGEYYVDRIDYEQEFEAPIIWIREKEITDND